jgi:hypothetical protein
MLWIVCVWIVENSMEWYNVLVIAAFCIGFIALVSGDDGPED